MHADRFPSDVVAAARASAPRWGLFPSVILAQWALESAYGTRMSGRNNPFGIKATAGQAGTLRATHEQNAAGVAHVEQARFADYNSMADAFEAHGRFLSTQRYAPVRIATTPDEACRALRACGYATDVSYPGKLLAIIETNGLRELDRVVPSVTSPGVVPVAPRKPTRKGKAAAASAVVVASGAATAAGYHGSLWWLWLSLGLAVGAGIVFAILHFRKH